MADRELGGNIVLADFDLDEQEMIVIKKLVGNYAKRIRNFTDYEELKLELKSHQKNKDRKKYEIKANLVFKGNRANSEIDGLNPFIMIDKVMKKILAEVEHIIRK